VTSSIQVRNKTSIVNITIQLWPTNANQKNSLQKVLKCLKGLVIDNSRRNAGKVFLPTGWMAETTPTERCHSPVEFISMAVRTAKLKMGGR